MENHYLLASSAFWLPAKRNGHDATPLVPHEHSIVPSINNYAMGSEVESPRHWPQGHWIPPRVYVTGHLDVFWQLPFQRTFGTQGPECCFCSFVFVKCQTSSNQVELDKKTVSWNCWETSTHKQFVIYIPAFSNIFVVPSRCPPFLRGFYYHRLEAHGNLPGFCSLSALWGWWLQKLPRNVESSDLSDEESSPLSATVRSPFSDMT